MGGESEGQQKANISSIGKCTKSAEVQTYSLALQSSLLPCRQDTKTCKTECYKVLSAVHSPSMAVVLLLEKKKKTYQYFHISEVRIIQYFDKLKQSHCILSTNLTVQRPPTANITTRSLSKTFKFESVF